MKRTNDTTNDATNDTTNATNDATNDTTNDAKRRDAYARSSCNARFTIASIAREHNINEKIARRRMRDAIKRNDERALQCRDDARAYHNDTQTTRDARLTHEFNESLRDVVLSIIRRD